MTLSMMLSQILLVAVLAVHLGFGARIPDLNVKSNTNMRTDKARSDDAAAAPKLATFLTECEVPPTTYVHGLCWQDETTALMLDLANSRIIKYDIDINLKLCMHSVLHENAPGLRMSCPSNGDIYLTDVFNGLVNIIKKDGKMTEWKPYNSNSTMGGIAVNDNRIALDFWRPINLYDRQQKFMYTLSSPKADDCLKYEFIISSSSSHLIASAADDNYIFIYDLENKQTITVGGLGSEGGKLHTPVSVSFDASEQYVLVSEADNRRISVFSTAGKFIQVLEVSNGGSDIPLYQYHATMNMEGKPSLLAWETKRNETTSIKIFTLSN